MAQQQPQQGKADLMPLGDHIEELRARVIRCLFAAVAAFVVCWLFRERVLAIIMRPHCRAMAQAQLEPTLKFRSYTEPVLAQLKASLIAALVLSGPYIIYQLWAFLAPGLFRHERRVVCRLALASVACLAAGVGLGYFLFIPVALRFLLGLSGADTEPVLMIGAYISLFFLLTVALGVAFQTPIVMFCLVRWGVVDAEGAQKQRKSVVLAAFVLAAALTPPDPFTQIMMAVPLILLYDLGVLAAAPRRETFVNFLKFAGVVAGIAALVCGWFFLWPVGTVEVIQGSARAGTAVLTAGERTSVRRGQVFALETGAAVRLSLGRSALPFAFLVGEARLQVHSARRLSLYGGALLVNSTGAGPAVQVRTQAALATLRAGRAEFVVEDPKSLRVTVAEGEVLAVADGRRMRIGAGHSATFQPGGEAADTAEMDLRWRNLIGRR